MFTIENHQQYQGLSMSTDRRLKICILARKRLTHNTRVVRQAKVLMEAGHVVTVVAIELPTTELINTTPRVRYCRVNMLSWLERARDRVFGHTRELLLFLSSATASEQYIQLDVAEHDVKWLAAVAFRFGATSGQVLLQILVVESQVKTSAVCGYCPDTPVCC